MVELSSFLQPNVFFGSCVCFLLAWAFHSAGGGIISFAIMAISGIIIVVYVVAFIVLMIFMYITLIAVTCVVLAILISLFN